MSSLIPLWIIGGPFLALIGLSFAFKGHSAMGGSEPRLAPRGAEHRGTDPSAPLFDPMHADAPRRIV